MNPHKEELITCVNSVVRVCKILNNNSVCMCACVSVCVCVCKRSDVNNFLYLSKLFNVYHFTDCVFSLGCFSCVTKKKEERNKISVLLSEWTNSQIDFI